MPEMANALSNRAKQLAAAVEAAQVWIDDNRNLVKNAADPLLGRLRKSARLFRRCEAAALRKMCVGVFGPSQAGKSYLISALARNKNGSLPASFGSGHYDFLKDINPEGGKESTGLVTRFTLTPQDTPAGYPVRLGLLSEMDIVKIIANTFYSDCEHKDLPDVEAMRASLDALGKKAAALSVSGPDRDDMEDLHEYVSQRFSTSVRINPLDRAFWPRAEQLAPRLVLEDRAVLFAHIWDNVEEFTALYLELARALNTLGREEEAFCGLDALIPRERSIIDVATLAGLGQEGGEDEDYIEVVTKTGKSARMARNLVTALTAELTIVMPDKPDELFEHVDLLDFPGYRSRLKIKNIHQEIGKPGSLQGFFLRGKVSYLFERYCAENELSSMLLCIGPGNQEVQDLPGVIDAWVRATHGETPEERKDKSKALFFVLTKFDLEFEEKMGASATAEGRWKNRLHASLLDFFGKQYDWPLDWDGSPFNNLFWLRNPNFKAKGLFDYDGDREVGIRKDQEEYINGLYSGFINSPEVTPFFKNPQKAWESAMCLGDGGITYLRESLRPMCNPEIKLKQLEGRIAHESRLIYDRLAPYWRSDDREEERKAKIKLARRLSSYLAINVQEQRFGRLLADMQLPDYYYYDLYFQLEGENAPQSQENNALTEASLGARTSADDLLGELFGDFAGAGDEAADTGRNTPGPVNVEKLPVDEAGYFAMSIEKSWIAHLHSLAESSVRQGFYKFPAQEFGQFVHELVEGAARLNLRGQLEEAIRKASRYRNISLEKLVWKQVSQAANIINSYVDWLGFKPGAAEKREVEIGGKYFSLFEPMPEVQGYPELPEDQSAFDRNFYRDWLAAFLDLARGNADHSGSDFNVAENSRLGDLLRILAG
ncbi:MAG: type III effector HopL1 [Desulfovibrionaceae bacterium]|nr:type III effector HopL1 [Desulfovibrionaceae bacterium]